MTSEITQRINQSFARQDMMNTLGARIDKIDTGKVVLTMQIAPFMSQQHGAVHAGATFALGDSASGYAALTVMEPTVEVMTAEMKINLLAPAVGARLIASGRVVKAGKRLIVTQCDIEAEDENGARKVVAILQGTMVPVQTPST
ncbi:PaaI family thioesterase [Gymnodinialimonas ulvae]|uniref:PaaI family thioesterase n=1 Tax=Gymnodinialimonas ulvae TaxID=3126504 RepID=UPI0030ECE59F